MIKIYLPEETLKSFKKDLGKAVKDPKVRFFFPFTSSDAKSNELT